MSLILATLLFLSNVSYSAQFYVIKTKQLLTYDGLNFYENSEPLDVCSVVKTEAYIERVNNELQSVCKISRKYHKYESETTNNYLIDCDDVVSLKHKVCG